MHENSFTTAFTVPAAPEAVYAAVLDVRGWWSENISGPTDQLGEAFDYRYEDMHRCRIRVTEMIPGRRVAWHVLENFFSFTGDTTEWTGTDVYFDITPVGQGAELRMTHAGLVPEYECYDICRDGWGTYVGISLRSLITTGRGNPNRGEAITSSEKVLTGATA